MTDLRKQLQGAKLVEAQKDFLRCPVTLDELLFENFAKELKRADESGAEEAEESVSDEDADSELEDAEIGDDDEDPEDEAETEETSKPPKKRNHGKSEFHVGHMHPLKGIPGATAGHTAGNVEWVSSAGNRIQGSGSIEDTLKLLDRIAENRRKYGAK